MKKEFKTFKGLIRHCVYKRQFSVKDLFSGFAYYNNLVREQISLSDELKQMLAKEFADYVYSSKSAKTKLVYGLVNGLGDLSLFKRFYYEADSKGEWYFTNNLSGDAYNYCLRKYSRSI